MKAVELFTEEEAKETDMVMKTQLMQSNVHLKVLVLSACYSNYLSVSFC